MPSGYSKGGFNLKCAVGMSKKKGCINPHAGLRIVPVCRYDTRRENVVAVARIDRLVVAGSRRVAGASLGDRQK